MNLIDQSLLDMNESERGLVLHKYKFDNGKVCSIGYFKNGEKHGVWRGYNGKGHLTYIGVYLRGWAIGLHTWPNLHEENYYIR